MSPSLVADPERSALKRCRSVHMVCSPIEFGLRMCWRVALRSRTQSAQAEHVWTSTFGRSIECETSLSRLRQTRGDLDIAVLAIGLLFTAQQRRLAFSVRI